MTIDLGPDDDEFEALQYLAAKPPTRRVLNALISRGMVAEGPPPGRRQVHLTRFGRTWLKDELLYAEIRSEVRMERMEAELRRDSSGLLNKRFGDEFDMSVGVEALSRFAERKGFKKVDDASEK